MVHMMDLTGDIMNMIFVLIAISDDGARDLARARATCKLFSRLVVDPRVLRVINCQNLINTNDFTKHHHENDFLGLCAVSGNRSAKSVLGKALLVRNTWFWRMIRGDNQLAYCGYLEPCLALHHHSLVRTYIIDATSKDISAMRQNLVNYVIKYVGYKAARDSNMIYSIFSMCSYEAMKLRVSNNGPGNVRRHLNLTFGSFESVVVHLNSPPEGLYRETVIDLFDKLFPSALY